MPNRQAQADAVTNALADWLAKTQAFDAANDADIAAKAASNAAATAANGVKWKLVEHSGASRADIIQAEQLADAADTARAKYDAAFQVTAAASAARNDARDALRNAVDALDQDGKTENMGGTIL